MLGHRLSLQRKREEGIIIILAAVFMLFVMGAMAALSIDVVTFYAARSEAQLAADAAALAAARVLANSGATSDPTGTLLASVEASSGPAQTVANQVAARNEVGGVLLTSANTSITFGGTTTNPTVTVHVQVATLPTFFARIWGTKQVTVGASATAEAYNPSGLAVSSTSLTSPVAPSCVKPWLLPNLDPSPGGSTIFDPATGQIQNPALLGWESPSGASSHRIHARCTGDCSAGNLTAATWEYYPLADARFPAPIALPACAPPSDFQKSIAGCVQTPLACGTQVVIDTTNDANRDIEAKDAVNCMANLSNSNGDRINSTVGPPSPSAFEFRAGDDNPLVQASVLNSGDHIMVSDSLVTVPVFDNSPFGPGDVSSPVTVIGFVQLFLQPGGNAVQVGSPLPYQIRTRVINIVGCGTNATGTPPVYGNGASAVPVRLITPP